VSALRPQHWQLLVVGASHGSRSAALALERLLEAFRPAVIFLELDRQDFALLRSSTGTAGQQQPRLAHYTAHAAPECVGAISWALGGSSGARRSAVVPVDRDQLTTRRRLAYQIAQQPLQLLQARRYWGSVPASGEPVGQWCERLRRDCPAVHEVVIEERNQFMAYQILLHLDSRLRRSYGAIRAPPAEASAAEEWASSRLSQVGAAHIARTEAALEWVLDGPPCGAGGLWSHPEWCESLQRPAEPPSPERVLVLCGPAHVDGLSAHLAACLGGGDVVSASTRHFLARNAAVIPRLLANMDWPWGKDSDGGAASPLQQAARLAAEEASLVQAQGEVARQEARAPGIVNGFLAKGFGPLTLLAEKLCDFLIGRNEEVVQATGLGAAAAAAAAPSSVFLQDRLRDLSRRPLPVWPVFLTVYLACPVLLFIVIPAHIDIYWLHAKLRSAQPQ